MAEDTEVLRGNTPDDFDSENKKWRGTSINDLCKGKGPWSFAVTPVVVSRYHWILCDMPVTLKSPPKPHYTKEPNLWDDDHVRMPYSEKNLFSVKKDNSDVIKERWKIICDVLSVSITTSQEFEAALNKYNSWLPKFDALHYFFNEELNKEESDQFFTQLLPKIIALALRLPEVLPSGIPLLKQNHNRSLSLSQLQISCLLANGFLCTFPWKKSTAVTYPGVNFVSLFSAFARPKRKRCICEKLKSICNYFRRVTQNVPVGVVTFERKMIPGSSMPRWDSLQNNLGNTKIHISSEGTIEDNGLGFLQVDFANKNVGGGVLRYGCVQEEIRFVICPELIVSRLFVEQLGNGESVIITGAERYNNYTGYGDTYEWTGDCQDDTPFDVYGRRKTTICVIDATRFNKPKEQFQGSLIRRELNKAYVGFHSREKDNLAPVATGNWGCGAFKGSKSLKTLIQLVACSAANRNLVYYSFGDEELMENFYNIHLFLANNQITIAQLWRFLNQFSTSNLGEERLYSFIQQAYFDSKKQPTISHFFSKANATGKDKLHSAMPSTSFKQKPKVSPEVSPKKGKIEEDNMDIIDESPSYSSSSEDIVPSSQPKGKIEDIMDIVDETPPCSSSSEEIFPSSQPETVVPTKFNKLKHKKTTKDIVCKMPKSDLCDIFDMLDGNGNQPKNSADSDANTDNILSIFDDFASQKKESSLKEVVVVKDQNKLEVNTQPEPQQILSKKKITDFFTKINK